MKIAIAALLVGSAAAFAPVAPAFRTTALSAVATGPNGKAAKSAEEDLELTREVINSFMGYDEPEEETKVEEKEEDHGQNATKAAKRACRNAIEFNSLSIKRMIPGGYDFMKLNVILAVPKIYQDTLDVEEVAKTFPYGDINFVVQDGGMIAPSGRVIESLGDKNDDMLIVCAAVQVGY